MFIKPRREISRVTIGFKIEFQGVMPVGVVSHLSVGRRDLIEKGPRPAIIDNPILARLHQEDRLPDPGRGSRNHPVDEDTRSQQARRRLVEAQRIGRDERLALAAVGEKRRI
jgi:hypothetical protein